LPAARLKPLPFPDPARLIDLVEQDPSLVEPGLRIAARRIPLPHRAGGMTLDALALDAAGRCLLLRAAEILTARTLEEALAARAWIVESLPAIGSLCPPLAGAKADVRCLLLTSRLDESAAPLIAILEGAGVEVSEVQAFDSPGGLALSVRSLAPRAKPPALERSGRALAAPEGARERRADPLAGIPLSAEEAAEFRKLSSEDVEAQRSVVGADRRPATAFRPTTISRGTSLEN